MIEVLKQGPYLHALGWTSHAACTVTARRSDSWRELARTLAFRDGSSPTWLAPVTREAALAPLAPTLLKASGVARARSAARSTVLAACLGKELGSFVASRTGFDGDRVGIGVVSCSAIVPVFWKFESVGVGEAWDHTDTMLLPASIPSSVVTAVSSVTDFHAAALTFAGGAVGAIGAIEHAYLDFFHDRADFSLVVCAEEACMPMLDAMQGLAITRQPIDGAAGMVLSRERLHDADWQICFAQTCSAHRAVTLPQGWADVSRITISYADRCAAYTGTAVPQALHLAVTSGRPRAVIEILMPDRARCVLGLQRWEPGGQA